MNVDYLVAARRHIRDGHVLQGCGYLANAGQLFGICVECGLKYLLVLGGAPKDLQGDIQKPYRDHIGKLNQTINTMTTLPDGRSASRMQSRLPNLSSLADWTTDHRYWTDAAIPLAASLAGWEMSAMEMDALLDEAVAGGVL